MTAVIILIGFGVTSLAIFIYLGCSFLRFCREDKRRRNPVYRITDARQRVRRIFRDAERRMDEATGQPDSFNFGSRADW